MELKDEFIFLRALEPSDLNTLYSWENDPLIWRISNTLVPFSRFTLEQYLLSNHSDIFSTHQVRLMVCLHTSEQVGTVELFDFDPLHRRAGIGILIQNEYRTKGYAKSALHLLCNYAYNTLLMKQLYCNIGSGNATSLALFKNMGFSEVGLKKSWNKLPNGSWEDEWLLQKIKIKE